MKKKGKKPKDIQEADTALDIIRKKYKDQIMKRGQPKKVRGAKSTVGTGTRGAKAPKTPKIWQKVKFFLKFTDPFLKILKCTDKNANLRSGMLVFISLDMCKNEIFARLRRALNKNIYSIYEYSFYS